MPPVTKNTTIKTIVVLGFPRSATSLIAKSLSTQVDMGKDLLLPNAGNPKGYYESKQFITMNERILAAAGGDWCHPPSEAAIQNCSYAFAEEIAELVRSRNEESKSTYSIDSSEDRLWGWKDPRTTLTAEVWLPHLTNPHFVCCFRNPNDAAKSLSNLVPHISFQEAIELSLCYNERMLKFLRKFCLLTNQEVTR